MIRRFILKHEASQQSIEGVQFSTDVVVLAPRMGKYRPLGPVCHANIDEMLKADYAFGSKDEWTVEWVDREDEVENKVLREQLSGKQFEHEGKLYSYMLIEHRGRALPDCQLGDDE